MPHRQSFGVEGKASSKDLRDIRLFLPSEVVSVIPCAERLVRYEFRYRIAQAHAALRDLRERLVVRQHLYSSKKRYSHGTEAVTRSNRKIEAEGKRIAELASRYRTIRQKLVVLSSVVNESSWQDTLRVLEDKDIQGLTTEDHTHRAVGAQGKKDRLGAGRKQLTWIWFVGGPQGWDKAQADNDGDEGEDDSEDEDEDWMSNEGIGIDSDDDPGSDTGEEALPEDDPALRIEFCTTRARAHRWQEECLLLKQEMDRVERFWRWDPSQWREREERWAHGSPINLSPEDSKHPELVQRASRAAAVMVMGKLVYARRQSSIRDRLHEDAVRRHAAVRVKLNTLVVLGKEKDPRHMVECGGRMPAKVGA
jgi:hypothetical protein